MSIINNLPDDLRDPPEYLSGQARNWFCHIVETGSYDAPSRILLIAFLTQWDTKEAARCEIAKLGKVFKDRWGQPRENPWCKVERESTREMGRLFRLLGWDQVPSDQMNITFRR